MACEAGFCGYTITLEIRSVTRRTLGGIVVLALQVGAVVARRNWIGPIGNVRVSRVTLFARNAAAPSEEIRSVARCAIRRAVRLRPHIRTVEVAVRLHIPSRGMRIGG
jgi:hypothetical protein